MVNMKILDLPLKAKWYEYFEAQEERFHRECFGEIKTERGTLVQTNLFDK
jgi:hypothetical protein